MLTPNCAVLAQIETPALVVDGEALQRNIVDMAGWAERTGIALRPHAKTHKCVEIATMQLHAGAVGIACATVREAEALSSGGIREILVTSPFMGEQKFTRAARLGREAGVAFVVDHPMQLEGLRAALGSEGPQVRLLIDVDVGHARTGVTDPSAAVELARMIVRDPRFTFAGVQGYAGHAQHVIGADGRKHATAQAADRLRTVITALEGAGLQPAVVSGSGTGTHMLDAGGPYNELQVGSYIFMDAEYGALEGSDAPAFRPALFVLATVISTNRAGEVTVDAGTKVLATNGPPPRHIIGAGSGATYAFAGDEHGILTLAPGQPQPALGDRVLLGATHCDPTVNLHAWLNILHGEELQRWPVVGRHD